MQLGSLTLTFHRTDRVPDGRVGAALPPNRGEFPVLKVADYAEHLPPSWEKSGIFLPIHPSEALWINFRSHGQPVAILMGAGGVNAVTGEKLGTKLETDNYMVTPPQPWIDGWKTPDGTVRQFVATFHEGGKGKTVAEQIIGEESTTGALGLALFGLAKPIPQPQYRTRGVVKGMGAGGGAYSFGVQNLEFATTDACLADTPIPCAAGPSLARAAAPAKEMGLGAGGKIDQKIYPDPYGLEYWKPEPSHLLAIYFVDAVSFGQKIGRAFPAPRTSEETGHPGFKLHDGHLADNPGTDKFDQVETVPPVVHPALKTGAFSG